MKKINKFIKLVNWKFICLTVAVLFIFFLLPITILCEKAVHSENNQLEYTLRNNIITWLAIIFRQSGNGTFFQSLTKSPEYLVLLIFAIKLIFYSFALVPLFIKKLQKSTKNITILIILTFIIATNLVFLSLMMAQKFQQFIVGSYPYFLMSISFQAVYILPFVGYLFYFVSITWYLWSFLLNKKAS